MNDFFKNKRILITGAARRVGAFTAEFFASCGAEILVHANKSVAEAEALASKINGIPCFCDLADVEKIPDFFAKLGKIDILINNASLYVVCPLADESVDSILKHYKINFIAPVILMQCMKKQALPESVILNILDREITLHTPDKGSYLLSRKSLADATLEFAKELAHLNIRVNAIAPGSVLAPAFMPEKAMTKTIAASPMKRTASLDDLVKSAAMLIANRSLTGQILQVDAGQHLL